MAQLHCLPAWQLTPDLLHEPQVNVSELGLVTPGGKVVWGKYAQVTNNPGKSTHGDVRMLYLHMSTGLQILCFHFSFPHLTQQRTMAALMQSYWFDLFFSWRSPA